MAIVKLKSGKNLELTREQGHEIWAVLQGEKEPTPEQEKFINEVEGVILSFNGAPDSYIVNHLNQFIAWCKQEWLVDTSGKPVKPQTQEQWATANLYGFAP